MKVGDKIRGFKFEGKYDNDDQVIRYLGAYMDNYINKIGVIRRVNTKVIAVDFKDEMGYWNYPKEEAEKHLVKDDKPIQYQIGIDHARSSRYAASIDAIQASV